MGGIKDLAGLQFWMDNSKKANLEQILNNQRQIPKDRAHILRDLEEERKDPPSPAFLANDSGGFPK